MDQAKSDRDRLAEIELIYSGPTTGAAHDVERIKWLLPFARLAIEAAAHEPKPAESEVEAARNAFALLGIYLSDSEAKDLGARMTALDAYRRARGDTDSQSVELHRGDVEAILSIWRTRPNETTIERAKSAAWVVGLERRARGEDVEARIRAESEVDCDALRKQVETLREALKSVQAVPRARYTSGHRECPWCNGSESIATAALAATDPEKPA